MNPTKRTLNRRTAASQWQGKKVQHTPRTHTERDMPCAGALAAASKPRK